MDKLILSAHHQSAFPDLRQRDTNTHTHTHTDGYFDYS